jgi:hypothetical protein
VIIRNELQSMWQNRVIAPFHALFRHLHGRTEKVRKLFREHNLSSGRELDQVSPSSKSEA